MAKQIQEAQKYQDLLDRHFAEHPGYLALQNDQEFQRLKGEIKAAREAYDESVKPLNCQNRHYEELSESQREIVDQADRKRSSVENRNLKKLREVQEAYGFSSFPKVPEMVATVDELAEWLHGELQLIRQLEQRQAFERGGELPKKFGMAKASEVYQLAHLALERLKMFERPAKNRKFGTFEDAESAVSELYAWMLSNSSQTIDVKTVRKKKSTSKGNAEATIIAALNKHHDYANDNFVNDEPIGVNELARLGGVAKSTVSLFFNKKFNGGKNGGYAKYRHSCRAFDTLLNSLKALNGDFSPFSLYGRAPRSESSRRDDE